MDPSCLINTIFLSEKRKNVLVLLLNEGPKNIDEIKEVLDVNSSALMPQIKKLLKWGLVTCDPVKDIYQLSDMGVLIVEKLEDFLNIINIYAENHEYWETRDLSEIPYHMRKKIGNLKHCELLEADRDCLFEFHPNVVENILASKYVMMASSTFQPQTVSIFSKLLQKNAKVSFVLTGQVFDKFFDDFPDQFKFFLGHENMNISIRSGHIGPLTLVVTNTFMALWLFDKNGRFDGTMLISYEESALKWGRELFTYYSSISNMAYIDPDSGKMEFTGYNITKANKF
ncbi:MAG: winged helix-turn-helix domain-containing protein [Methanosarcina sp.]|uniref:helix-turn-helix transcriptional regulator n=1 Tax=Methanosarcina sp. TaxID=2213 RepID=UPI00261822C0|nr:winged helix-turn-helix domain-containing protein [Methanosarcina sp.]MDD3248576.1 winged helix-turn-helix domain-containing protein [Methanosarcina sp.]